MNHDHSQHDNRPKAYWGSRYSIGLLVLSAIALYFLLTEHRAHFFSALPLLLLLACLLMHVFMHRGHSGHGSSNDGPLDGPHAAEASPPPVKPTGSTS